MGFQKMLGARLKVPDSEDPGPKIRVPRSPEFQDVGEFGGLRGLGI